MHSGPPTSISPNPAFGPLTGQTSRPRRCHLPRTARCRCHVEPALRHAGVTPMSSSSSPALPLLLTAKGQSAARQPWPRRRRAPYDSPRILAIHVPRAVSPYLKPPPSPRGAPNPSRPRGNSPTNHAVPPEEKGEKEGRRRKGAARGRAVRHEDRSRQREETDPPGTTTSPSSSSSPTTRRRLLPLPPRRQATPPHFTDALHFGQEPRR
jgi:hypothetical protein